MKANDRTTVFGSGLMIFLSIVGCSRNVDGFQIKNGKPVYITGTATPGSPGFVRDVPADPSTFKPIPNHPAASKRPHPYAADSKHIFIGLDNYAIRIEAADPATFRLITPDGVYARDKANVYYQGAKLTDGDPDSFEVLTQPYSRDAKQLYVGSFRIRVRQPAAFEVTQAGSHYNPWTNRGLNKDPLRSHFNGWARDGVCYYFGYKRLDVDYDTFERFGRGLAKDAKRVFKFDHGRFLIIRGADPKTFAPELLPGDREPGSGDRYADFGTDIRY